jgi:hypothetical protein
MHVVPISTKVFLKFLMLLTPCPEELGSLNLTHLRMHFLIKCYNHVVSLEHNRLLKLELRECLVNVHESKELFRLSRIFQPQYIPYCF